MNKNKLIERNDIQKHYGKVLGKKNGYEAIECKACEFIHIYPLPTEKELDDYYTNVFYSDFKPDYINSQKKDLEWWNIIFRKREELFSQNLVKNKSKRILDIGSGPGFFLKFFKDKEWDVVGIEPSKSAAVFSRGLGLKIIQDSIYKINSNDLGLFDVVHSNQVFEHLIAPEKALEVIHEILNPNGFLFLSVANDYNPIQKIAHEKLNLPDWWFIPPEHINYFSINSISTLLESKGYDLIDVTTTFPIDLFLLMGDDYISKSDVGKDCHQRRKNMEIMLDKHNENNFKQNLYNSFKNIGLGREIEVLARKQ
jgi:SAM-dependent methyltransferase